MKKIAIKKLLLAVAIATATNISFAQTPYDSFAPSDSIKPMLSLAETDFFVLNPDSLGHIAQITIDIESFTLRYYDKEDSLVADVILNPTDYKWWSVDPLAGKYPGHSPYNFVMNSPILYIDPNGDSVAVNFSNHDIQNSFNAFFNTGVGRNYLAKYAAAGQTINGHTFKKDGKFHKKGIDLNFTDASLGTGDWDENGNTSNNRGNLVDGRLKLTITMNSDLNQSEAAQNYQQAIDNGLTGWQFNKAQNEYIVDRAKTIIHETFIHAELFAQDYLDDGNPKNYSYTNGIHDHHVYVNRAAMYQQETDGTITPLSNPNANDLFYYYGWYAQKAIHKWYGTGYTENQMYNHFWSYPKNHK